MQQHFVVLVDVRHRMCHARGQACRLVGCEERALA